MVKTTSKPRVAVALQPHRKRSTSAAQFVREACRGMIGDMGRWPVSAAVIGGRLGDGSRAGWPCQAQLYGHSLCVCVCMSQLYRRLRDQVEKSSISKDKPSLQSARSRARSMI